MKTNNRKYVCSSIGELRAAFNEIKTVVAGDTRFMAQALLFIAERIDGQKQAKPKRKPSEWQRFVGEGMKAGKSLSQISEQWQNRKAKAAGRTA
jgi:DNA-binding NarL/FixJ family response regulator